VKAHLLNHHCLIATCQSQIAALVIKPASLFKSEAFQLVATVLKLEASTFQARAVFISVMSSFISVTSSFKSATS
jgi:hypothetical protein